MLRLFPVETAQILILGVNFPSALHELLPNGIWDTRHYELNGTPHCCTSGLARRYSKVIFFVLVPIKHFNCGL